MTRKSKEDWLMAGWYLIAEEGAQALKIEVLTTRLNVTKGSFYHHFANFQGYKEQLLAYLEQIGTLDIIAHIEQAQTAATKLHHLLQATLAGPLNLEAAVRAWALQDEQVQLLMTRIDKRRIDYLQQLYQALGFPAAQALTMGRMIYAIYVGGQQMMPPLTAEQLNQLYNAFHQAYGLELTGEST
ncbi:MAG: TetR/AcrR family transcriptional regulator [Anaerolineales bacterium]|nr:TetR/AcrR family transcriptional regulator [Anaerolineales bacterium]